MEIVYKHICEAKIPNSDSTPCSTGRDRRCHRVWQSHRLKLRLVADTRFQPTPPCRCRYLLAGQQADVE